MPKTFTHKRVLDNFCEVKNELQLKKKNLRHVSDIDGVYWRMGPVYV